MRGSLACVLQRRLGALPVFQEELVVAAGEADRIARSDARRKGFLPGVGVPFIPREDLP